MTGTSRPDPGNGGPERFVRFGNTGKRLMAWPGFLLVSAIVFFPMIPAFVAAFADSDGFTLSYVLGFFTEPPHLRVLGTTISVALIVSVASVCLVLPACMFVAERPGAITKIFVASVVVSFWISILVRTFAWQVLLSRSGPIAGTIGDVFGAEAIPQLMYTRGAVIAAMVQIMVPYATLMLLPATRQIDRDIILAARVMGANPWTVFRKAYWPQIMHATLAAWLLTFIISMGFFVTPALLGGTREIFMVMLIESELHSFNISWAATDSLILMLTMALAAGLVVRLTDLPFNRLVGGATK